MNGKVVNRVLLTNDDGIEGEGLAILEAAAQEIANEVWVVAPEHDQSGTSSSISLHNPLRVTQRGERRWSVMGTPSDCTIIAVRHLMADTPPDLVLSGVNRGANLGDDVVYSGTVGAAMTASFLGLPALALSQTFRSRTEIHWEVAAHWTPILLRDLAAGGWPGGACYTVNFPDVPLSEVSGVLASRQGRDAVLQVAVEAREDLRAKPYFWLSFHRQRREHEAGTDVDALRRKAIAVTPLRFDRTANEALTPLQERLDALVP